MINFKETIAKKINEKVNSLSEEEVIKLIEIPPKSDLGDYALPCFQLAKILKKSPQIIAQELKKEFNQNEYFDKIESAGPYLNFFINSQFIAKNVLANIVQNKERYGASNLGKGENIVIDFSSPNVAKPFHVGHLRSTVIGNSLYKIYEFLGYNCIGINHLGDWGTQFGKVIAAYKKWGNKEEIKENSIKTLLSLYVKFHDEAEEDDDLADEGRRWFKKLEDGDKEALTLWQWFVDLSLKEFDKIYDLLDVEFDYYTGESFYNDKIDNVIQELKEKDLLIKSKGAYVVDLEDYDMPPCLILKSDGATIYPTRDIAAAIYRKKEYDFTKALYITDYAQNLHFAQWMKVIELMGYDWAKDLEHIPFGRVSSEEGKLQTRKGNVILLEELISKAITKVKKIIEEKNPNLKNKKEVVKEVAIGAIIFNDLSNSRIKDIVFNWDTMLSFEGETGPYIQYTHARLNSVLEKSKFDPTVDVEYSVLSNQESINVIKELYQFPEVIIDSMKKNEPSIISNYLINLAQKSNKFYNNCPILVENNQIEKARITLIYAVKIVLKTGLKLLGIKAPDKM